jgi:hypothetical protein
VPVGVRQAFRVRDQPASTAGSDVRQREAC